MYNKTEKEQGKTTFRFCFVVGNYDRFRWLGSDAILHNYDENCKKYFRLKLHIYRLQVIDEKGFKNINK